MQIENSFTVEERERRARADRNLWSALGTLYRWRRFIIGVTALIAATAVVLTLMMPNVYRATSRVLLPEAPGGGLAASLLKNLPSSASALLGAGGGDYVRYLAILHSRTVQEALVDSFDLVQVYELEESKTPREDALALAQDYIEFELDAEYDFLSVSAIDRDPQRAADMSNFLVRRLNDVNARLLSQSAGDYRRFIERRYFEAEAAMDSVLDATQAFQSQFGVYDLPAQTQGFFEQVADLRAKALQAEIQYEVLRDEYGENNAQVETARRLAQASNAKYREALEGGERLLPVPQSSVPGVVREYASLEMERTIQAAILEVIRPMYEQARLQEQQKMEAVQVLDRAVPPVKKAAPRRSIMVLAATFSAFLLAAVFALVFSWWRRNHALFAVRLQEAAAEPEKRHFP